MKKLTFSAFSLALLSCIGHFYLAQRAYKLSAGFAGASPICNINEKINCDQALLSSYAKIFGMSISDFGFSIHLILAFLLFALFQFGLSSFWKNMSFYLSSLIAFGSVVMIVISLTQSLYCPVCWTLYLLSFLITAFLFFILREELLSPFTFLKTALKEKKSYLTAGSFLILSIFLHASFVNNYDLKNKKEILNSIFIDWQGEPVANWKPAPLLKNTLSTKEEGILLVEFADFLCPSCKRAHPALKKFLKRYPEVSFHFYAYPLDGACNSNIPSKGSGLSCQLSKALICGEENSDKSLWKLSDFFFEKQKKFISARGDDEKIKALLNEFSNELEIDEELFENCMKSELTEKKLQQSILAGESIGLRGTPTFLMNGKKIRGHSERLLILNKIYQHLKSQ